MIRKTSYMCNHRKYVSSAGGCNININQSKQRLDEPESEPNAVRRRLQHFNIAKASREIYMPSCMINMIASDFKSSYYSFERKVIVYNEAEAGLD
jgi:hypothetical protein